MDKEKAEQFAQHEQLRITIPEHALLPVMHKKTSFSFISLKVFTSNTLV